MKTTVAICTWNRAALLERTLGSFCRLIIPEGVEWELLMVNNNSTDTTEEVIASYKDRLPVRKLFEPKPGKSYAANLAIKNARGDYIIWTDDDVTVDPHWLSAYIKAFIAWPGADYFGGTILPDFAAPPPPWIQANIRDFAGLLGIRDLGPEERPFTAKERPFGANMAFRRTVLDKCGFDVRLGPKGGKRLTHEETVLMEQLRASGSLGIWVPEARVRHYIPRERFAKSQIWHIYYTMGKSEVMVRGIPQGKPLWRAPRFLYRQYWRLGWRYCLQRLMQNPQWGITYARFAEVCGTLRQCRELHDQEHSLPILRDLEA